MMSIEMHMFNCQVTEESSSVAVEPIHFKRSVNKLLEEGIEIDVLTTDRSPSNRKVWNIPTSPRI